MFKGFQKGQQFKGFPALNFQMNNEAYGFSGCTFWLDAAYGLNTQTNLAAVSNWTDKISNRLFTQSTAANQPRFISSELNFNNYPVVEFLGARHIVANSSIGVKDVTISFIAKVNITSTQQNVLFGNNTSNSGANGHILMRQASVGGIGVYNGNSAILNSGVIDTSTHIVVITNNEIVVDGVSKITGNWIPAVSLDSININNGNSGLQGMVAEIIIYNRKLSSSEMIILSNNINTKYAIY
jgi:hypothetical protein